MNVPWFVARRYIRPQRFSAITIIGAISVVGILIGTAALVIVMSLFNGFRSIAESTMIGFGPHLQVVPKVGKTLQASADELNALCIDIERVTGGSAISTSTSKVVLRSRGKTGVAQAVGAINDAHPVLEGPRQSTFLGNFYTQEVDGSPAIVVSSGIAEGLSLRIGDTVELISPESIERSVRTLSMPRGARAIVSGMFQSNAARDIDQTRVYVNNGVLQSLLKSNKFSSIDVQLSEPRTALAKADAIQDMLPNSMTTRTWEDLNSGLVSTMKLERIGSFLILALIVIVASFNVLVSLTLGVLEKRRDIAVLLTVGLSPAHIRKIYLMQGLTLGCVAVILGTTIGVLVCLGQQTFGWISFDMSQGYLVPTLPLLVDWLDVAIIAIVGLALASTAAMYPAIRASRTVVASAIRVE